MSEGQIEHYFQCPSCWEEISMVVDLSGGGQTYVEDCEVCCRPLQITYMPAGRDELASFAAEPA
jgi:transcription elongation factor Elf1